MVEFAGLVYGLLLTFVLSSAGRNKRDGRAHSPKLVYAGYVLCGLSAGIAVLLPALAFLRPDTLAALA